MHVSQKLTKNTFLVPFGISAGRGTLASQSSGVRCSWSRRLFCSFLVGRSYGFAEGSRLPEQNAARKSPMIRSAGDGGCVQMIEEQTNRAADTGGISIYHGG